MSRRHMGALGALIVPFLLFFVLASQLVQARETAVSPTNTRGVIINEWSQGSSGSKEWVELLVVESGQNLSGWDLGDSSPGDLIFAQHGLWAGAPVGGLIVIYNASDPDNTLPPPDRDWADCVVVVAHDDPDLFLGGWPAFANSNAADSPHLRRADGSTVHDFAVAPGSPHPGGGESVRFTGDSADGVSEAAAWQSVPAPDATPGAGNGGANSAWIDMLCSGSAPEEADLALSKTGPATAVPAAEIVYRLQVVNLGQSAAADVMVTDTLPAGLRYRQDDSGITPSQPVSGTLVWALGELQPGAELAFDLTVSIDAEVRGTVTNTAVTTTSAAEAGLSNNSAQAVTQVSPPPSVLLDAVHFDGIEDKDADEAVAVRNLGDTAVDLSGWSIDDGSTSKAIIPAGTQLAPGATLWVTGDAAAFQRQFGSAPGVVAKTWPGFANNGDEVVLRDGTGRVMDVLVYGRGSTTTPGWLGAALQPYTVRGVFGAEGQILYRMRAQRSGLPVADTNQAADWAQAREDMVNGRKVRYPGWDLDEFFQTRRIRETAVLTVAIAPDNAYEALIAEIKAAETSLQISTLTFENLAIADALKASAERGVDVTILLEGAPSGGLPDQEKYVCQQLEEAGAECWFMVTDDSAGVGDRYRFLHAKYMLIDGRRAVISSENFSPNSLPSDDKQDGTWGRRGLLLITDARGVVAHLQDIFARDLDPANHVDLVRWRQDSATYGSPPPGFVPVRESGGITYTVRYMQPQAFRGNFVFEVVQSPENSLRTADGLLGLVGQVGAGDTLLVQQLQERPFWGSTTSNPIDDPNPRLEAYVAAARRGATVSLLLDAYFDNPESAVSNAATCRYVNGISTEEGLRLTCATGNPTGLGIHNKMVLAEVDGLGYVHVGSLNGTEQASKGNREIALQVQSSAAYALLADLFVRDFPRMMLFPVIVNGFQGPANHVLISEVFYDPIGLDDAEFVELVNPTTRAVDLGNHTLGDAVNRTDFEDVRRFPAETVLPPGGTLVVATSATAFYEEFGRLPDFELLDTETAVPVLPDDPTWGDPAALLQLGNAGDELILRAPNGQIIDALTYGNGQLPDVVPCALVTASGHSLERFPYWRDTNNCTADFRDWPFPNPGQLP